MFFRKKKNKSGVISVQIIDKSNGRYKLIKTIGSSADASVIDKLVEQAQHYIIHYGGQTTLDFILGDDQKNIFNLFMKIYSRCNCSALRLC